MQNIKYCCLFLLVLIVATEFTSAAPAYNDYENSIRDLYELLLQKEAIEERIGAHQVARKSGRSPSLRLRFGRRSDPSLIQASPYMLSAAQDAAEIAN